ncbi:MAG: hypothetical protein AABX00_05240 [Nanoarchaeota archaeon]
MGVIIDYILAVGDSAELHDIRAHLPINVAISDPISADEAVAILRQPSPPYPVNILLSTRIPWVDYERMRHLASASKGTVLKNFYNGQTTETMLANFGLPSSP